VRLCVPEEAGDNAPRMQATVTATWPGRETPGGTSLICDVVKAGISVEPEVVIPLEVPLLAPQHVTVTVETDADVKRWLEVQVAQAFLLDIRTLNAVRVTGDKSCTLLDRDIGYFRLDS
jgi:hypothetical protein